MSCAEPSYFNFNTLKCESCLANKYFNVESKKCEDIPLKTDKYNSYLVEVENFAGDVPNYDLKYATCESTKPYFNGEDCIECKMPLFFNM